MLLTAGYRSYLNRVLATSSVKTEIVFDMAPCRLVLLDCPEHGDTVGTRLPIDTSPKDLSLMFSGLWT